MKTNVDVHAGCARADETGGEEMFEEEMFEDDMPVIEYLDDPAYADDPAYLAYLEELDSLCNADYTTGGNDPYSTSCHVKRDVVHTVHEGRNPLSGDGVVRWEGGGSCAGDPLPYRNVVWDNRPTAANDDAQRVPRDEATRLAQLEEGELPVSEPDVNWDEVPPNAGSSS